MDIDDCMVNSCAENSTCVDGVNSYSCLCEEGTRGEYCELEIGKSSYGNFHAHCSDIVRVRAFDDQIPLNTDVLLHVRGGDTLSMSVHSAALTP